MIMQAVLTRGRHDCPLPVLSYSLVAQAAPIYNLLVKK